MAEPLQLYEIDSGTEKDWIAAHNESEARAHYMREYELDESDVEYLQIRLVKDPETVTVHLDEVDAETEEPRVTTAADVMAKMTKAGVVASTIYS